MLLEHWTTETTTTTQGNYDMSTQYLQARSAGWIAPLAIVIAGYRCRSGLAAAVRAIHPAGAAVIFGAGFAAGTLGSLAALLIAAAFLAGLYLSTRIVETTTTAPAEVVSAAVETVQQQLAPALPTAGLQIQSVTLKQSKTK